RDRGAAGPAGRGDRAGRQRRARDPQLAHRGRRGGTGAGGDPRLRTGLRVDHRDGRVAVRRFAMTTLVDELAEELWRAGLSRPPVAPLTDRHPELVIEDAYAIQSAVIEHRTVERARVVGRKVGLTARPMQELLGVDEPDYGVLLDDMVVEDGDEIPLDTLLQPRVE